MTAEVGPQPPAYQFADAELLVAIPHRKELEAALRQFHVVVDDANDADGGPEESPLLGLAKLPLKSVSKTADLLNLDQLLKDLYAYFEDQYADWAPTMGKNRLLGEVVDGGELSYGGQGQPEPIQGIDGWPPARSGPGRNARVGVLDTAVAAQGPLAGWTDRYSDILSDQHPYAVAGHATFVAGLILSQAPAANIEVRSVLGPNGTAKSWDVAKAIVEFGRTGLDLLNLSLVCHTEDGKPPMAIATAIDRLDPKTVVVAAAGNHGTDSRTWERKKQDGQSVIVEMNRIPAYPAALEDVVAVGAADNDGVAAEFTPRNVPWIDIMTTGVGVVSTYLDGTVKFRDARDRPEQFPGFAQWNGSSFAAALVTGAIAAGTEPPHTTARASLERLLTQRLRGPFENGVSDGKPDPRFVHLRTYQPVAPPGAS